MYRQGDVLLIPVTTIPETRVSAPLDNERVVLAHGEATGHSHSVSAAHVAAYLVGLELYLRVLRETPVAHEEHAPIILPPGDYVVRRQREYTPEEVRNVQD